MIMTLNSPTPTQQLGGGNVPERRMKKKKEKEEEFSEITFGTSVRCKTTHK